MNNLLDYCYKFIEENKDLIHLNYKDDDKINTDNIQNYADSQEGSKKFMLLIKKLYEQVTYISSNEFINIIDKNIDEIKEYIDKENYEPIILLPNDGMNRSFSFFTLYLLKRLKENKIIINNGFSENDSTIINRLSKNESKKYLIIICDDLLYSGTQLTFRLGTHLQKNNFTNKNYALLHNIKYFVNIIGLTTNSKKNISSVFGDKDEWKKYLILPKNIKTYDITFNQIISNLDIKYINENNFYVIENNNGKLIVKPQFNYVFNYLINKYKFAILPFFKYPDELSVTDNICKIPNYNNIYYIDYDEFNKDYPNKLTDNYEFDLENIIGIWDNLKIKMNILFGNNDLLNMGINWIKKTTEINKNYIIQDNNKKSWIKLFNNCNYTNINDKCHNICYDKTFYKSIKYTYNNHNIDIETSFTDLIKYIKKQKYLKYKKKYLDLKKALSI